MPTCAARILAVSLAFGVAACALPGRLPAPAEGGPGSPVAVTRAFYAALHAGDAPRAAALVGSPNAARATQAFVALAQAYEAVERALQARFGARAEGVGYASRVAAERAALAGADAAVEGDRATVTGGGSTLASLQRIGGAWKVMLEDALATDEGVAALEAEADASRRAAERVVPAIRGGLYDSADDALQAFRNELSTAGVSEEPDLPPGEGGEGPTADPVPGPVQL